MKTQLVQRVCFVAPLYRTDRNFLKPRLTFIKFGLWKIDRIVISHHINQIKNSQIKTSAWSWREVCPTGTAVASCQRWSTSSGYSGGLWLPGSLWALHTFPTYRSTNSSQHFYYDSQLASELASPPPLPPPQRVRCRTTLWRDLLCFTAFETRY